MIFGIINQKVVRGMLKMKNKKQISFIDFLSKILESVLFYNLSYLQIIIIQVISITCIILDLWSKSFIIVLTILIVKVFFQVVGEK